MGSIQRCLEILRLSIREVFRQRRRYFGVMLAIALGTAGLIVVITVGRDVKANLNNDLDLLGGATRIKVIFQSTQPGRETVPAPRWFRPTTVDAVKAIPGVLQVSLAAFKNGPAFSQTHGPACRFPLVGVDEAFWELNRFTPVAGRFFGREAVEGRQLVCVLGRDLAERLFGRINVAGSSVLIDHDLYAVVGVLGGIGIADRTGFAFIPFSTAQDRVHGFAHPDCLYVRCTTWDDVAGVAEEVPRVLDRFQPGDEIRVEVAWEQLKRIQRIAWWVETFIYLAIVATMILGGMGIWNGMMTAVRARTHEIGIKKAIGAEGPHILLQFLTESLCLSVGSTLLGIGLGWCGILLISRILSSEPSPALFVISGCSSIGFSLFLGLAAGLMPSIKASRMEVVSALKYE